MYLSKLLLFIVSTLPFFILRYTEILNTLAWLPMIMASSSFGKNPSFKRKKAPVVSAQHRRTKISLNEMLHGSGTSFIQSLAGTISSVRRGGGGGAVCGADRRGGGGGGGISGLLHCCLGSE